MVTKTKNYVENEDDRNNNIPNNRASEQYAINQIKELSKKYHENSRVPIEKIFPIVHETQ